MSRLAVWCWKNNNVQRMWKIVVYFRRAHYQHASLSINCAAMERLSSTNLRVHVTEELSGINNTPTLAKETHQDLYFL